MKTKWIGLSLVLSGLFIFIRKSKLVPLYSFTSPSFILFLLGSILIIISFLKSSGTIALTGGIMAAIGLHKWGIDYIEGWPSDFEILVMLIGIAFLIRFAITKHRLTAITGIVILLCGLFAWPGIHAIPFLGPTASLLNLYWPALIVCLGLILLIRK